MRLRSIDALRGIASILVVFFHHIGGYAGFLASPAALTVVPAYGYAGVYLFFVISGFCIHLRWVKGKDLNFREFWKRRMVRLYPAYLATLGVFIWWNGWTSITDLVLHVFMLHNWTPSSVFSINGVLWTLAVEEQLYLLYFLLLKMRVKFGWPVTLAALCLLRFAFFPVASKLGIPYQESALTTWVVWALGALAVELYHGKVKLSALPAIPLLLSAAALHYFAFAQYGRIFWILDTLLEQVLWGAGFFFLVSWLVRYEGANSTVVAVVAFIGLFSYSLYLTHPIVPIWAALPFAYAFYVVFEKPFIELLARQAQRKRSKPVLAAKEA